MNAIAAAAATVAKRLLDDTSSEDSDEELTLFTSRISHRKIEDYVADVVPSYNISDFKSHFRLTRSQVEDLCMELETKKPDNTVGRPAMKLLNCVLLSLWTLANQECFRSVGDRFGVSPGHAQSNFMRTCKLICLFQDKYIKWPVGADLIKTVKEFNDLRGEHSLPNVIGCVDGTHIAIKGIDDNSYYNRKGYYSMLLQVICNSKKEFIDVFYGCPGSSHDTRMWSNSPICFKCENEGLIPDEYHLLGDSAYPLKGLGA